MVAQLILFSTLEITHMAFGKTEHVGTTSNIIKLKM